MIINSNDYTVKTFGIKWSPVPDYFTFTVCLDKELSTKKRKILPEVTKLFDPFGWLSQTTIQLIFLLQILWIEKLTRDENVLLNILETIRKISTLAQRIGEDQIWTTSFCSTFFVIFGASCVLWRLIHSLCRSCLRARANGRPSAHTNADSQNTRCPKQNFVSHV